MASDKCCAASKLTQNRDYLVQHHAVADIADMQQRYCQLLDIGVLFLVAADRDRLLTDLALTALDCAAGRDSFPRAVFLPESRVSEMA